MFFNGSRYLGVADRWLRDGSGRIVAYKAPRRVAAPDAPRAYVVRDGDRPDLAAWAALGDPERFWELCDANGEPRPSDLTARPGRRIAVPGVEGT
jgi:hypothetical protein